MRVKFKQTLLWSPITRMARFDQDKRRQSVAAPKLDPLGHRSVLVANSWVGGIRGGQMIETYLQLRQNKAS